MSNPKAEISSATRDKLVAVAQVVDERGRPDRPPLPKKAPALWAKDRLKGDTPVSFFKRVYEPWVGQMTRKDVGRLDHAWYAALSNWLRRNEIPADVDLPTIAEMNDRRLEQLFAGRENELGGGRAMVKQLRRLSSAMEWRIHRTER